jgi:nucleoside-diphosphate-sugar epimerase
VLDALIPEHGENWLNIESIRGRVQVNISDMRDLHSLNELIKGKDFIFNLAGQVSHGDSMRDLHLDLSVNCISSMNLVESYRKNKPTARLIYTSTRQVYGVPMVLPVTEAHPAMPIESPLQNSHNPHERWVSGVIPDSQNSRIEFQ